MRMFKRGGWPFANPPNCAFELNTSSPQARGLVGWWPMNGSNGRTSTVLDYAFNRYPMTLNNSPAWSVDAQQGRVLLFDDGSSEYLEYGSPVITGYPFSITGWAYSDDATAPGAMFGSGDLATNDFHIHLSFMGNIGGDPIRFSVSDNGIPANADTTTGFTANKWAFVCGVARSSTDRAVYIDGGSIGTSIADTAVAAELDNTCIGVLNRNNPFGYFSGRIADVRTYNRALTAAEVRDMYINRWELYKPVVPFVEVAVTAAPAGAIMNQIQSGNLGADLYNGALI